MKKERRQELKENELAEILARWYAKIAPHSQKILIAVLVIVIVYLGWTIWSRWAAAVENEAWQALHAAMESGAAADYETVAERFPRTNAGYWAQLLAADTHLQIGCRQILVNKADGAQELRKALDGYLAVRNVTISPLFQQRVLWGLGRAYEALSGTREGQGELDRAMTAYRELVQRWPDGPFSSIAKRRLESLEKSETREFYDALAAYEPVRPSVQPPSGIIDFGPSSLPTPPVQPSSGDETGAAPASDTKPGEQVVQEKSETSPPSEPTVEMPLPDVNAPISETDQGQGEEKASEPKADSGEDKLDS
ncbi:MAG: hypothetical protein WBH86_05570 [Thermogutta sp.]|nr:tetratricopeptide repeat protein [Thermogutta sp.]HPZ81876.1 tetratricopeptide repeat protein [Thermogutta sp.]HQF15129.1 tetratricopeptide repeat protein [Thermogutta sp.]